MIPLLEARNNTIGRTGGPPRPSNLACRIRDRLRAALHLLLRGVAHEDRDGVACLHGRLGYAYLKLVVQVIALDVDGRGRRFDGRDNGGAR